MNRIQLREATYARCGLDSTDARLTTTRVDGFVNDALHQIEVEHDWPWLQASTTISAVSGTGSYSVPSDWLRTRYLRIDADSTMERYDIAELDDRWPDSSSTGRPSEYAVDVDAIVIRPIPDTSYTITHRYIKREPDLTDDSQSPLMPASFHAAIAELAAYLGLRSVREETRSQVCLQEYQQWQQRMMDDRRRFTGPARIRTRPGGFY